MKSNVQARFFFPRQLAILFLASAFALPAVAQQGQPATEPQANPSSAVQQQASSPAAQLHAAPSEKEGFWGRINPFARKKWVKKRLDPLQDRLGELYEVQAKNAHDVQDVDARAQAGIRHAQSTADQAGQVAAKAGEQAGSANALAQQANGHIDRLNSTVGGLDQYQTVREIDIVFHGPQPVLSAEARNQLDDLANGLAGREGYIFDIEGHAPFRGTAGIQSSSRLNDAVQRYLVLEHQIPIYRLHAVALGDAPDALGGEGGKPVRGRTVHVRLMENSLAAQGAAPPQSAAPSNGAERP